MSPESRTLVVILLFGIALASCCLCVPVVALVAVPAIARVRVAAEQVRTRQRAEQDALRRTMPPPRSIVVPPPPRPPRPPIPPLARGRPGVFPAEDAQSQRPPPIAELEPQSSPPPPPEEPANRRSLPAKKQATGLAALSDFQRRTIYRSATMHERIEATMKLQIDQRRQRGFDSAPLERMLRDRQSRQAADLDRLRETYRLTPAEFEQVLAEGREKGW